MDSEKNLQEENIPHGIFANYVFSINPILTIIMAFVWSIATAAIFQG